MANFPRGRTFPLLLDPQETYHSLNILHPHVYVPYHKCIFLLLSIVNFFLQDLSYARDELARHKTNFSVDVSGKEAEIEALRWELTTLKVRV